MRTLACAVEPAGPAVGGERGGPPVGIRAGLGRVARPGLQAAGQGESQVLRPGGDFRPRVGELPQLFDDVGQRFALDELHGVVVHPALAADRIDRHDAGVVELRRRLGLNLEPLELLGVGHRGEG
jgi:hypothetical protein